MNNPAATSPDHNGNQKAVLRAIQRGSHEVSDIARVCCLNDSNTRTAIKRLIDAGEIRRGLTGGYVPVKQGCRLSEVWRGRAA